MRVKQISNHLLYFRQYSRVIASRDAKLTTIAKASPFKPFDLLQVNVIKLTSIPGVGIVATNNCHLRNTSTW